MPKLQTFRIGTPRKKGEGVRIGTVRFLPRGVKKEDYARLDFFDVWFPLLAPSQQLFQEFRSGKKSWEQFRKGYRKEMSATDCRQAIALLIELAKKTPIVVGCYCEDESRCHRSLLFELINEATTDR